MTTDDGMMMEDDMLLDDTGMPEDGMIVDDTASGWDDVADAENWRVFNCKHGTCSKCHEGLIADPGPHSNCPLCRCPLALPILTGKFCLKTLFGSYNFRDMIEKL